MVVLMGFLAQTPTTSAVSNPDVLRSNLYSDGLHLAASSSNVTPAPRQDPGDARAKNLPSTTLEKTPAMLPQPNDTSAQDASSDSKTSTQVSFETRAASSTHGEPSSTVHQGKTCDVHSDGLHLAVSSLKLAPTPDQQPMQTTAAQGSSEIDMPALASPNASAPGRHHQMHTVRIDPTNIMPTQIQLPTTDAIRRDGSHLADSALQGCIDSMMNWSQGTDTEQESHAVLPMLFMTSTGGRVRSKQEIFHCITEAQRIRHQYTRKAAIGYAGSYSVEEWIDYLTSSPSGNEDMSNALYFWRQEFKNTNMHAATYRKVMAHREEDTRAS